ncbi:uncharacterized protein LOC123548377 isoform X2 [Mercenaria mercenaria]|nr:uncharacterized protein LOC123548377 isoform X2 [Mercenaria mercenaria]
MPSFWRYFCCICDSTDKRSYSARDEWTSRRKNSRRTKSGKNTWARRSLLDNEQVELNEITREQIPYQMRAISTPTYDTERMSEDSFQDRLLEHFAPKKRPTVHGVFENSLDDSSASKTTFPWMDERFVPNGRNGTRLGISAVQMNAKRSGTAVPRSNVTQTTNINNGRPHAFPPNAKSHSFTEGQHAENVQIHARHVINSTNLPKNVKNIQNGHVSRNNFNTSPKEVTDIRRPVRLGVSGKYSEKPMVLKAPTSDVGVRRVSSKQGKIRQERIPKLEDYTGTSAPSVAAGNQVVVGHSRPSLMDIFPNSAMNDAESEIEADVSYASEIIFRKQPSEYSGSEVSLKRSAEPGMFSANTNKYERLKPERIHSEKSKPEKQKSKGKYSNLSTESMYGYVPKVVQNVHASNALEGTKIDDFFMQRMQERQLESFGSLDNNNVNSDEETIIITTLVESTEDLTATDKTNNSVQVNETLKTEQVASSTCVSSEKLSIKSKATDKANTTESSSISNTLKHDCMDEDKTKHLKTNDDKVIMIDFPPNLENNKKIPILNNLKTRSSNESNSEVSNRSTTSVQTKLITGEVLY